MRTADSPANRCSLGNPTTKFSCATTLDAIPGGKNSNRTMPMSSVPSESRLSTSLAYAELVSTNSMPG